MLKKISNNWVVLSYLIPLIAAFFIANQDYCIWEYTQFKSLFFNISIGYSAFVTFIWFLQKHHLIFEKKQWLRNLIILVSSSAVLLYTYKHKITYRFDILLLILCFIEAIWQKKWIKPNGIIIFLGLFSLIKSLGIFWNSEITPTFTAFNHEENLLILSACILGLFFRLKHKESLAFISICFKLFLALLTINIIIYIFYITHSEMSFFSFLTLNKKYLSYMEIILHWSIFAHPSFIPWAFLIIGGLAFLVWKNENKYIYTTEMILYNILLLIFILIMQSRVGLIGYFLSTLFFIWLYISKNWSLTKKSIIIIFNFIIGCLSLQYLITHSSFFNDPIRIELYKIGIANIQEDPLIGKGTAAQEHLAGQINDLPYLHNDFLGTWVDLGLLGLVPLVLWIGSVFYIGIKRKNDYLVYAGLMILLLMNTDTFVYIHHGIYICIPLLIGVLFQQTNNNINQKRE